MKARIVFKVSIIADMDKKTIDRLQSEIEKTLGTSLDIELGDLSYLDDKTDEYIYVPNQEGYEEDYTQVLSFEII